MVINYNNKQIAVFADTHGKHRQLPVENADIAIHLGDACTFGNNTQFTDFLEWFSQYPAKYKLFIAGNHELQWEESPEAFLQMFPKNIIFLRSEKHTSELQSRPHLVCRLLLDKKKKKKIKSI